ncbi:hypothetical protein GCM10009530_63270 [Microbispora corallina]|uniref:Uncharacterized protein n=1 Tax=Microbispora corallina TaxID=83302 RepID=A0ABQ4GBK0_9ACTN|nr:hypothetical protein [Microbispora corallina]GIH44443.1 hypothetical protein Mco01_74430 [Microbispora corallina]
MIDWVALAAILAVIVCGSALGGAMASLTTVWVLRRHAGASLVEAAEGLLARSAGKRGRR